MTAKSSQLVPLQIQPGIFKNYTAVESGNIPFYVDGDKVRFRELKPQKLGGWVKEINSNSPIGCIRSIHTWQALDTTLYLAAASHNHFYVREGGTYFDITPIRATSNLTDPITTTSGSDSVSIADTLHSASVGDFIEFDSDVTYNGITFTGEYEVQSVTDANNYVITGPNNATGSGTGGGSVDINYFLESGLCDSGNDGFGWGTGLWSDYTWGTPRTEGIISDARITSIENWGEDLLILPVGGALYYWDVSAGTGTRATEVVGVPDQSNWMIVSSYFRQCILFGTKDVGGIFDPLLIRWSDNEDYTEFDPTADGSNAGEFRLTRGTKIISALETRNGEILVFTDKAVYRMRPRADDLVYEITLISDTSGIISPKSVVDVDGRVYWMSDEGFRMYDGVVRILPSSLDLFYFDSNNDGYFNEKQKIKCFIGRNREFDEVWFFLPDKNNIEINRYVVYNYKDNVWYDGMMERTAWEDAFVYDKPYAFNASSVLYAHEDTHNDDGMAMDSYITTGFFKLQEGNQMLFVDRFILDGTFTSPLTFTLDYKKFPSSSEVFTKEYDFNPSTNQIFTRARGRYVNFKIRSNTLNGNFRVGEILASIQPSGER